MNHILKSWGEFRQPTVVTAVSNSVEDFGIRLHHMMDHDKVLREEWSRRVSH